MAAIVTKLPGQNDNYRSGYEVNKMDISHFRREYLQGGLNKSDLAHESRKPVRDLVRSGPENDDRRSHSHGPGHGRQR